MKLKGGSILNIFKFEIKMALRNSAIWIVSILLTLIVFMKAMYPIYIDSAKDIEKMLSSYPPQFAAAFGINIKDIFSYGGFYSFCFNYIGIIAGIMAAYLGVSTFAREKKSKTMDFLFTKPISRKKIFLSKFLSNVTIIVITNILYIICGYIIYKTSNDTTITTKQFIIAMSGLFFTQIVFLAIGIVFSIFVKKIRSIAGVSTAIGFTAYILSALANILKEEKLNYISPLKYFSPSTVFTENFFDIKYVIAAILLIVICICSSYIKYKNCDIQAV